MAKPHRGEPGWMWRRWVIFPNVITSYTILIMIVQSGFESSTHAVIATGLLWNIIGSIAIYTGFATMQDIIAIWRTRSGLPYDPATANPEEPAPDVDVKADAVTVKAG